MGVLLGEALESSANIITGSYTRVYKVIEGGISGLDAYSACKTSGIPVAGSTYPEDTRSVVDSISAQLISDNNQQYYLVTVEYNIPDTTGGIGNPPTGTNPVGLEEFSYSVTFSNAVRPLNYIEESNGQKVTNTIGEDVVITGFSKPLLQITQTNNVSSFSPSSLTEKVNTVNASPTVIDRNSYNSNTLLFTGFNASTATTSDGINYIRVSKTWLYDRDEHTIELRNQSVNERKDIGNERIKNKEGHDVTEMVDITEAGLAKRASDGNFDLTDPFYFKVRIYKAV